MSKVHFPRKIQNLLEGSPLEAPIRDLAVRVGEILADNKLPFFPDYTDHGVDHINRVLATEIELIPNVIFERSTKHADLQLLCDSDAALIIGATLLHDLAMHLRIAGFKELVDPESRFKPLPWYDRDQEGHLADRPWHLLWEDYLSEARRFDQKSLADIVGKESVRQGWKFDGLPADSGSWERNDSRVVGEFLRRHHARLSHEIAIYGFPGLPIGFGEGQFPALGKESKSSLTGLSDLIGATARSHGAPLRVGKTYLESDPRYRGTVKPMQAAAIYAMVLLRVADYLQIEGQRAPAALLRLRDPQSPKSVLEWQKHLAVQSISASTAPRAKMVTVSENVSLEIYLQLRELLKGLQNEMDHSVAILDESYGSRSDLGLDQLNLATSRIDSNLFNPEFSRRLPYLPERIGFTADPHLLTLLVEPLYGYEPCVGIRELMQNAVDAVCEIHSWCGNHGTNIADLDLPSQDCDVLIEYIRRKDATWFVRVQDRGIGMTSETLQHFFLRAGASFRHSTQWKDEFASSEGGNNVVRSGRFGIGAFAAFLLGPTLRLSTRHADTEDDGGYVMEASEDSGLIKVTKKAGLPVGTTIEVDLSANAVAKLQLAPGAADIHAQTARASLDWFCWDWPTVEQHIVSDDSVETLSQQYNAPIRRGRPFPEWSVVYPNGFDAVYWTFAEAPQLACNGFNIRGRDRHSSLRIEWPLLSGLDYPNIAVQDSAANLPLTIQRYELSRPDVNFESEVFHDVILSLIAHALVCGPKTQISLLPQGPCFGHHPLSELDWCSTSVAFTLADPWLYSLLETDRCLVYGTIDYVSRKGIHHRTLQSTENISGAVFCVDEPYEKWAWRSGQTAFQTTEFLEELSRSGINALGHEVVGSRIVLSANEKRDLPQVQTYEEPELRDWSAGINDRWKEVPCSGFGGRWEICSGTIDPRLPIEKVLSEIEAATIKFPPKEEWESQDRYFYVAEIATVKRTVEPKSEIASVWSTHLGPNAIPFDSSRRQQMIARACESPDLRRHIVAWDEMQKSNSRWSEGAYWEHRRHRPVTVL